MDDGRKRPAGKSSRSSANGDIDPHWTWAESVSRGEERDDTALGVEAAARLKLLQRAATNFVARLPSIEEWAAFLRTEIIPVYNAILPDKPMCRECGTRMRKKSPKQLCSAECASRFAARGRKQGGRGNSLEKHEETAKIHVSDLAPLAGRKPRP